MRMQDMDQNSLFLGTIGCEAIQALADVHRQKSVCDKPVALKTFLKISCELYQAS